MKLKNISLFHQFFFVLKILLYQILYNLSNNELLYLWTFNNHKLFIKIILKNVSKHTHELTDDWSTSGRLSGVSDTWMVFNFFSIAHSLSGSEKIFELSNNSSSTDISDESSMFCGFPSVYKDSVVAVKYVIIFKWPNHIS